MKYIVAIAIVFVIIWLIRASGRRESREREAPAARPPQQASLPQDMVQCPVCHVHLPRGDALPGPDGKLFCCAEHRLRADR